jgi:hypothetical protein
MCGNVRMLLDGSASEARGIFFASTASDTVLKPNPQLQLAAFLTSELSGAWNTQWGVDPPPNYSCLC